MIAFLAFAGWVALGIYSRHYEKRAGEFNLAEVGQMESASVIYDRDGREFGKIFIQNRQPVPFDRIPPMLVKAVIAAEDNRFYDHDGVDYMGIVRAAITNYRKGRIAQGASTVTQQLARNSFELRERTYERKLVEMFLAWRIEREFSKEEIMTMYLNRVYFGSGLYGAEAAARGYFGRPAKDLDIGQCAMLAGLLKSPQALSPWNNLEAATEGRNFVLRRMREMGFITRDQLREQTELKLLVMRRTNPFKVSYAVDMIRQQAIREIGFERAMNGGFRIETTLDSEIQRTAERSVRDQLAEIENTPGYTHPTFAQYRETTKEIEEAINRGNMSIRLPEPRYLQAAALTIDNAEGGVLALVGGRDFKHSEYNRAFQGRRPAGTAFTPFVFAAAYENGIFPGEIVQDACIDNRYVMVGGETGILGEWGVEKVENEYEGPMTTREALVKGKNSATVRLGMMIGLEPFKRVAAAMGISSPLRDYSNSFLGSSEVTLDEMVLAYSTFAGVGRRPAEIHIIRRIVDREGKVVYEAPRRSVQAISAEAAFQAHAGLGDFMREGVGSLAAREFGLQSFPVAGKSGTAYGFTDTYFFGYTNRVTCGVWVGFDRPTKIFRGAFGKDLALPIWTRIMNTAAERFRPEALTKPPTLREVEICQTSGLLLTPRCRLEFGDGTAGIQASQSLGYLEYATEKQVPEIRCDIHGGGVRTFAKTYDDEGWPRAAAAVDLATIRPVAVSAPTLLGFNDVYRSVRPGGNPGDDSNIPVAKALPVAEDTAAQASLGEGEGVPVAPAAAADATPPPAEPEVRRAEAVTPLDSPLDTPAIQLPAPPPLNF
ncbi:MAG: transglycosylase domain-containing protein [Terrimicrobiaceae bacterium]|nr:transglycosylase domain-containing protein [Terrimicrobiaceae bacterium]